MYKYMQIELDKNKFLNYLISMITILIPSMVLLGWMFDIESLNNIIPLDDQLKTQISGLFLLLGLTQIPQFRFNNEINIALLVSSLILGFSAARGYGVTDDLQIEILIGEIHNQNQYTTLFVFLIYSLSFMTRKVKMGGRIVGGIGLLAMIGHIFHLPTLYLEWPFMINGISEGAASLFILSGIWLQTCKVVPQCTMQRMFHQSSLPFFVAVFDMHTHKFKEVSESAMGILGYTPNELYGRDWRTLAIPEDIPDGEIEVETNLRNGKPIMGFHNTYIHKDGSKIPLVWFTDGIFAGESMCIAIPTKYF